MTDRPTYSAGTRTTGDVTVARGDGFRWLGHADIGDTMHIAPHSSGHIYVGHMGQSGVGTSIVDVRDPRSPTLKGQLPRPKGTHTHKAQVVGDIMVVNHERNNPKYEPSAPHWSAGLAIYDLSEPIEPRQVGFLPMRGKGVHRMTFWEMPYVYLSGSDEGYTDQFFMIIDLSRPDRPEEVGRWWFPGMRIGEGEQPSWQEGLRYAAHHPLLRDNVAYCSWWDAGLIVLDVSDPSHPIQHAHLELDHDQSRTTHTALPLPGRPLLILTDEMTSQAPHIPRRIRLVDISDPFQPSVVGMFPEPVMEESQSGGPRFGPHNLHEPRPGSFVDGQLVFGTYFSGGVRAWDVRSADDVREVAHFIPSVPIEQGAAMTNDLYVTPEGVVYITDRDGGGLHILQFNP